MRYDIHNDHADTPLARILLHADGMPDVGFAISGVRGVTIYDTDGEELANAPTLEEAMLRAITSACAWMHSELERHRQDRREIKAALEKALDA